MGSGNEGLSISAETMFSLAQRGIQLELDIYGPDATDDRGAEPQA